MTTSPSRTLNLGPNLRPSVHLVELGSTASEHLETVRAAVEAAHGVSVSTNNILSLALAEISDDLQQGRLTVSRQLSEGASCITVSCQLRAALQ